MTIQQIELKRLQPTDIARAQQQEYLSTLTPEQIYKKHGYPEVWKVDKTLYISEGNNRLLSMTRKTQLALVDLKTTEKIPQYFIDNLKLIIKRAQKMQQHGIYTLPDLLTTDFDTSQFPELWPCYSTQ